MAIDVTFYRCLESVRGLYQMPRTFDRFKAYIKLVQEDTGTEALPLSRLNPMAKEHALAYVETLLAMQAEDVVATAVRDAASKLDGDDTLRSLLVLMDDAKGGWTNRAFAEFSHQYENKYEVKHGWATVVIWTAEEPTPDLLRARAFESVYRTVDERRNGPVRTLREILDRAVRTARFAGVPSPYEDAAYRAAIAPYLDSHAAPVVMTALYGDAVGATLGYPPLGIALVSS